MRCRSCAREVTVLEPTPAEREWIRDNVRSYSPDAVRYEGIVYECPAGCYGRVRMVRPVKQ